MSDRAGESRPGPEPTARPPRNGGSRNGSSPPRKPRPDGAAKASVIVFPAGS